MKKLKKLLSIVLAVAMVMSLAVSVTAGNGGTYKITITADKTGHTYEAYQIFTGTLSTNGTTLSDIEWGNGVNGDDLLTALKADNTNVGGTDTVSSLFANCTTAADVAKVLTENAGNSTLVQRFAYLASQNLGTVAGSTSTYTSNGEKYDYVISELTAGYYLVKDADDSLTSVLDDAYTRIILEVVGDAEATIKSGYPSFDKAVTDVNDSGAPTSDDSTNDTADYDVGDDVPFTLTASLPTNYSDYTTYKLTFHDELSDGLTFNDNVVVTVYTVADVSSGFGTGSYYTYTNGIWTEVADTTGTPETGTVYYTASTIKQPSDGGYSINYDSSNSQSDGCTFEVVIDDTNALVDTAGNTVSVSSTSKIVVTYTAKLSEEGTSHTSTNEAQIEYSNNPNANGTGKSTKDKTTVFHYELVVTKKNATTTLKGAGFTLSKLEEDTSVDSSTDFTTKNYYYYDAIEGKYVKATNYDTTGETTYYSFVAGTENVSDDGNYSGYTFTWDGLDDGVYMLSETRTPDGYNTMDDKYFAIVATHTENGGTASVQTLEVHDVTVDSTDGSMKIATSANDTDYTTNTTELTIKTDIINSTGSELPETGGIGVTIFYVVGGILVLAAAGVIVISKKRRTEK